MSDHSVPAFKKYDESLIKEHSEQYELSIQLAPDGFSFCIFHPEVNKFLSIETVKFLHVNSNTDFVKMFEQKVSTDEWLSCVFKSTKISFENNTSTLIPASLYSEDDKALYASFNISLPPDHNCYTDHIKSIDAYLIYTIPEVLASKIQQLFPGHKLTSASANLIESLLINYKNIGSGKRMFVNVKEAFLDIVIIEDKQVIFFNTYAYKSTEDFIYFIIFVIEQLNLNPEYIELTFSGFIDKKSKLFEKAYTYIRHINFQKLPPVNNYSYLFNDVPTHYYFNLLSHGL
jgi:hypothetical protein